MPIDRSVRVRTMGDKTGIRYRDIGKLIKSSKDRKKQERYVVEGIKMVLEAVDNDAALKIYASESWWEECILSGNGVSGNSSRDIEEKFKKCGCEVVGDNTFKELTDTVTPQGVIAIAKISGISGEDIISAANDEKYGRLLILENLQDPGNLGTIIRTAEAAGYKGILMNKGTADMYNPKVVRSTMGAIFRVPCAYIDSEKDIINMCHGAGITVYGAALEGRDMRLEKFADKHAFVIGNESVGITDDTKKLCDKLVRIPMCGRAESLNASVAAAVLMYTGSLTFL